MGIHTHHIPQPLLSYQGHLATFMFLDNPQSHPTFLSLQSRILDYPNRKVSAVPPTLDSASPYSTDEPSSMTSAWPSPMAYATISPTKLASTSQKYQTCSCRTSAWPKKYHIMDGSCYPCTQPSCWCRSAIADVYRAEQPKALPIQTFFKTFDSTTTLKLKCVTSKSNVSCRLITCHA